MRRHKSKIDPEQRNAAGNTAKTVKKGIRTMADLTIVYWRDIPAQVIVGKGRRGAKVQLPERFEQAIDRAAMKLGATDTDAYLAEWRKEVTGQVDGDAQEAADAEAARLDAEYDLDRIKALIANEGWA
jgi:hypothetical protein